MENEQKRMEVFGFLKGEEIKNRTVCTPFLPRLGKNLAVIQEL